MDLPAAWATGDPVDEVTGSPLISARMCRSCTPVTAPSPDPHRRTRSLGSRYLRGSR